jgi:uncharacterized protein YbbC (DUF1343 family)
MNFASWSEIVFSFTPTAGRFKGELCQGVFITVTNRAAMNAVRVGIEIAAALQKMGGDRFDLDKSLKLIGSPAVVARIKSGDDPARIAASWSDDEARFRLLRAKYLLYR